MKKNLPEFLSRFVISLVFIESGWGKFQDLDRVATYFESLGIPLAQLQAPFVSSVELLAGLFLLLGFKIRSASFLLMVIMGVALITAKQEDLTDVSTLFGLSEFLYIVILSWLLANGSKALSIDALICKRGKTESCTTQ